MIVDTCAVSLVLACGDRAVRRLIGQSLRSAGYSAVVGCSSGQRAVGEVADRQPDVVIVTDDLEDFPLITLVSRLRQWHRAGLIVLAHRWNEPEMVEALQAGADDYLGVPFLEREFHSRLRALLRRERPRDVASVITVGDLTVDLAWNTATLGGREVPLTETERGILRVLAVNRGRTVTVRQLLQGIWTESQVDMTNNLRTYMMRLRHKLTDEKTGAPLIETQWGVGYRLQEPAPAASHAPLATAAP